jgi:hypothetical protein
MIEPAGIVGSKPSERVPGARPAVTISWMASASVLPRRSGTATATSPRAVTTVTSLPDGTISPAAGSWLRTWFSASEDTSVPLTTISRPTSAACCWRPRCRGQPAPDGHRYARRGRRAAAGEQAEQHEPDEDEDEQPEDAGDPGPPAGAAVLLLGLVEQRGGGGVPWVEVTGAGPGGRA